MSGYIEVTDAVGNSVTNNESYYPTALKVGNASIISASYDLLAALQASQTAIRELRDQGAPTAFWDDIEAANIMAINKATKEIE